MAPAPLVAAGVEQRPLVLTPLPMMLILPQLLLLLLPLELETVGLMTFPLMV